jgi:YD repeat-containing protein
MHNTNVERTMRRAVAVLALMIAWSILALPVNAQQGGTTRYVYDDAGRLQAVITPTGEAIIYQYDAAGNFTALLRETADTLFLIAFSPRSGAEGDRVTIVGTGFGPGVNSVSFNGLQAQIVETTLSTIVAIVPVGATTGPITVNAVRGTATTSQSFIVRPKLDISPRSARVFLGESQQFTLTFSVQISDHNVTWSVNGVAGGNSNVGTISTTGLYTAPTAKSRAGNYTVRATSVSVPSMFIEAVVTVKDPDNIQEVRSDVSVLKGLPEGTISAVSVSVLRPNGVVATVGSYGAGVMVQYGFSPGANAIGPAVSVTKGPHIASVAPLNVARGTAPSITITGANLTGASALQFIRADGSLETGLVASNLSVSADGNTMTATITINGGVAPGSRVIFVTATAGQSTTHNTGLNVIGITQ